MAIVTRVLDKIIPERYGLDIDVDMKAFTYRIKEKLEFDLVAPSRELILHAKDFEIDNVTLDTVKSAIQVEFNADDETVTIEFDAEIPAGKHTLELHIVGGISDSLHGFYKSSYVHDGETKSLATTQLEAVHSREVFVCVDEPGAKAIFELSITAPDNLVALSNTNVTGEEPAGMGRKRRQFAPTPKMSTYLLAFIIGELEYLEGVTPEGVVVRAYATPGKSAQLGFAVDTAVATLSFYTDYFGIPYPLPKLDMIAIPDFASGAMENWGAVTYRETDLLLDPTKTSLANKQRVVAVVTHELAHQWFGNLVTMEWWNDLWLNEGFATWIEVKAIDKLFPDWQAWDDFTSSTVAYSMDLDGLANTHPIQVEVEDPRYLDEIFDAISYYKGASIINMLNEYVGESAFRKGLQAYLSMHQYSNSVTGDLWAALEAASGKPVGEVMSAWTSRPGYPIVSFDNGRATQNRFYSSPREAKKAMEEARPWPIPFEVVKSDGSVTEPELMKDGYELPQDIMTSDWFKPNPGQTGFFRTLYSGAMIEALESPMATHKLSPRDRFGVVGDVMAATEAGLIDASVALKLLAASKDEPDYVVWNAVSGGLFSILGIVEVEETRAVIEQFGKWLVQPNVKRLGWKARDDEAAFDTLMRPVVLQQAVRFDDEAVTAEAKRRFDAYLVGEPLDPDLRPVVLFASARHGGEREFDAILERYRVEESPQMKMSLLGSLSRFRVPKLIDRFLALGLSEDVRPQDISMVIAGGFRSRDSRDATWAYMKDNWEVFIERYGEGGHMLERFPLYAGMGFATHAKAQEIKEFFTSHPHPTTKRPTAQAIESVELRADWYDRDKDKIKAFLTAWKKTV